MRALRLLPPLLAGLFAVVLIACDGSDAVSLRIRLDADLSGDISASMLTMPEEPNALEEASAGVEWVDRAQLMFSAGEFADVNALRLGDMEISGEIADDGISHVRVRLPRGEGTRWYKLFTPEDLERRERMAKALELEGSASRVGSTIKIVIVAPGPVTSTGVRSTARGLRSEYDKDQASLLVPLDAVVDGEGVIDWHVVW